MSATSNLKPVDLCKSASPTDQIFSQKISFTTPTADLTRIFFTETSLQETALLLTSIAATGILSRKDLKNREITALKSNDQISDHTPDYVCLNVMCKDDGKRIEKRDTDCDWLDAYIRRVVFNGAFGVISVGIERHEDILDPMHFYGLNKKDPRLFQQTIESRAHGIVLFLLNPKKITLQKEMESCETISYGGEFASDSLEADAIEMVIVSDEILELTKKIFSSTLVVGVKSIRTDFSVKVPLSLAPYYQLFFRDLCEQMTSACFLKDILLPDFANAIRQIAEDRFGDLNDFSNLSSLSPLFFHAARLPV